MKLNIGAGKQTWPEFFCIDAVENVKASRPLDLIHAFEFEKDGALKNPLPLENEIAEEVHSYHFIEHIYFWEAENIVKEFHRLLKEGGKLIIECPDIMKCAHNFINGRTDQMGMWGLYGDWAHKDPFMMHSHGYHPATITELLKSAGFKQIKILNPVTHGARVARDMRVEAIK